MVDLDTACGVSGLDQLAGWLATTKPPGRFKRTFPMNPKIHRDCRTNPAYIECCVPRMVIRFTFVRHAKSLKQRVKSYFRQKTPHAEHTLEMLTQARELDSAITGSALEAAILESDEIKRRSPPYNIALRRRERGLTFFSKDLCRNSAAVEKDFPVGPLPVGRFIQTVSAFGLWLAHGMQVNDDDHLDIAHSVLALPPEYTPEIDCLLGGFRIFQENYSSRMGHPHQSALRFLTALGATLWRQRLETAALAEMIAEKENDNAEMDTEPKKSGQEHV